MPGPGQDDVSRRVAAIAFSLGALYFAYAFVQRVIPSIMTTELMQDFSVGGAALGSLSAFYFWAYASIQLPVGILTDRFGPRRLMSIAAATCAVATVCFAMSQSLVVASLWRAVIGASVAFAFVGSLAIAGYWFRHNQHAMLAGVLQSAGMLGAVLSQAPLRPIVESIGWRSTMSWLAAAGLILAILLYRMVPRRKDSQHGTSSISDPAVGLRSIAANPQTWLCALIGFGMCAPMLAFSGLWAVPWLTTVHDYSPTRAAAIASILFIGWASCSPMVGWLSDRIGRRNILVQTGAVLYIATFSWIVFLTPQSVAVLATLLFLAGGFGSSVTVCFVITKEHNDPKFSSTAVSLMNMFVVGSGGVMQPLIGWLLDLNWNNVLSDGARIYDAQAYLIGFSSLLLMMCAALVGTFLLKETGCRQVRSPQN